MKRDSTDKWIGGVIGGFATWVGVNSSFLRVIFIILFFGIGGLSFGIGSGAVALRIESIISPVAIVLCRNRTGGLHLESALATGVERGSIR